MFGILWVPQQPYYCLLRQNYDVTHLMKLFVCYLFIYFSETRSVEAQFGSNSQSSCFLFPGAGMTSCHHHTCYDGTPHLSFSLTVTLFEVGVLR